MTTNLSNRNPSLISKLKYNNWWWRSLVLCISRLKIIRKYIFYVHFICDCCQKSLFVTNNLTVFISYFINLAQHLKDKFNQLVSLLPDLREMAQRGEDFLYFKHMQGNAPHQTLLMEMLIAKKR